MAEDRIRVICGPTAAGKSAIAAGLALEYGATIISADSRQIYRDFDIGTAKPAWSERKSIAHEGIDIADPAERYSSARWAVMAGEAIARSRSGAHEPLVVGGTGFYLRALFEPLFKEPEMDALRRARLEDFLATLATAELRRWCSALDPARAQLGRVQLARAIEIALIAGKRVSALHGKNSPSTERFAVYLVVDPGPGLASRIEGRVKQMINAGWLEEVRALDVRISEDAPAWKASGYRTMRAVARGGLELSEARERIIIETRQYAKRQRTWFRHQLGNAPVTRVNPDDPDCSAAIQRWWKESA